MIAIALLAYLLDDSASALIVTCILGVWLLLLSWFDFDHYRLPDWLTLPLIAAGIIFHYVTQGEALLGLAGAALGYALVWSLAMIWRHLRNVDAIGLGDAKLLAAAGAWLGALAIPPVLLLASGAGLIYVLSDRILTGRHVTAIPFGPFIGLGMWIVWLFPTVFTLLKS